MVSTWPSFESAPKRLPSNKRRSHCSNSIGRVCDQKMRAPMRSWFLLASWWRWRLCWPSACRWCGSWRRGTELPSSCWRGCWPGTCWPCWPCRSESNRGQLPTWRWRCVFWGCLVGRLGSQWNGLPGRTKEETERNRQILVRTHLEPTTSPNQDTPIKESRGAALPRPPPPTPQSRQKTAKPGEPSKPPKPRSPKIKGGPAAAHGGEAQPLARAVLPGLVALCLAGDLQGPRAEQRGVGASGDPRKNAAGGKTRGVQGARAASAPVFCFVCAFGLGLVGGWT